MPSSPWANKKYFRQDFQGVAKYHGGSGVLPTDKSCYAFFDDVFVSVYNQIHAVPFFLTHTKKDTTVLG
jgi:hypothetical protein